MYGIMEFAPQGSFVGAQERIKAGWLSATIVDFSGIRAHNSLHVNRVF